MTSSSAALRFENLTLGYDSHPAVHHLDGRIPPGSLLAIIGPNGAGKSTLLKAIAGAISPMEGHVHLECVRAREIAYLPQQAEIDRSFPIGVFDIVAMGLWRQRGAFGGFRRSDKERIARAISAVGLEGFETRTLDSLSGGQLQRALFARLLVQDAPLILLDEPFSSIDAKTSADLIRLIERWHGERRTIVAVLHDLHQVKTHFPQTLLLSRRVVAWGDTAAVLSPENLLKARAMSEAWDEQAPVCQERPA
jgi:zinc/manganese transport system ATP-binding protein